jgi:amino-acid N-acetyltransferase
MLRHGVLPVIPAGISLRPARASDLGAACRLLRDLKLPVEGVGEWLERFTVAESTRGIVGLAGVETYADGALLRSVAVHPSMRGTGLGRALVERALGTARDAGAKDAYLLTTTAEGYFPRLGFTQVPRETIPASVQASIEFREACPASAVAMHRSLSEAGCGS